MHAGRPSSILKSPMLLLGSMKKRPVSVVAKSPLPEAGSEGSEMKVTPLAKEQDGADMQCQ